MTTSTTRPPVPEGSGAASHAPGLPAGFTDTFTSRYIDTGTVRLHAVIGGDGPPLLLVAGWPQTWYAWRLVMPALAQDFQVSAVDPRGVGLSDKPEDGYDTGTLAGDMAALMTALGHERFAMVGHDVGMWTAYALAADHPDRLERLAVAEAAIPGLSPSPPLFAGHEANTRLWHFGFNRLGELNEQLVRGREHLYFGGQFASKAARRLPDEVVRHYVDTLASDPDALHASFAFYRALDTTIAQNEQRKKKPLALPVLAIAGEANSGDLVANTMKLAATDVESLVIPDCGHYPAEEAPEAMADALLRFLAPYRDGLPTGHAPRQGTPARREHTSKEPLDGTTPFTAPPDRTAPLPINHIGMRVADMDAAIAWYRSVLGFELIDGPLEYSPKGPQAARLSSIYGPTWSRIRQAHLASGNGVGVELFEFTDAPEEWAAPWHPGTVPPPGLYHFCVTAHCIHEMADRIGTAGGRRNTPIAEPVPGMSMTYAEDLFGHAVEINSRSYEQSHPSRNVRS
ncbi:alpha/beta fold hydrolase [Streptomyces sediminimaris]|uniref:alpha/beta fold hydrolase n=1 Tax=Streptomyces sediminimaris TaxID=3383721 RepID=UPI00399BA53A